MFDQSCDCLTNHAACLAKVPIILKCLANHFVRVRPPFQCHIFCDLTPPRLNNDENIRHICGCRRYRSIAQQAACEMSEAGLRTAAIARRHFHQSNWSPEPVYSAVWVQINQRKYLRRFAEEFQACCTLCVSNAEYC